MIAIVKVGQHAGEEVTIMQYCNDWFSVEEAQRVFKPSSLLFTPDDIREILLDPNKGRMLEWYEPTRKYFFFPEYPNHFMSFKKRRPQYVSTRLPN